MVSWLEEINKYVWVHILNVPITDIDFPDYRIHKAYEVAKEQAKDKPYVIMPIPKELTNKLYWFNDGIPYYYYLANGVSGYVCNLLDDNGSFMSFEYNRPLNKVLPKVNSNYSYLDIIDYNGFIENLDWDKQLRLYKQRKVMQLIK